MAHSMPFWNFTAWLLDVDRYHLLLFQAWINNSSQRMFILLICIHLINDLPGCYLCITFPSLTEADIHGQVRKWICSAAAHHLDLKSFFILPIEKKAVEEGGFLRTRGYHQQGLLAISSLIYLILLPFLFSRPLNFGRKAELFRQNTRKKFGN